MIGDVATEIQKLFYECAQMNDWWIVRLAVMPDHIHTLVELPPTIALSQVVKTFKGGSGRAIRQAHQNCRNGCGETAPGRRATSPKAWI